MTVGLIPMRRYGTVIAVTAAEFMPAIRVFDVAVCARLMTEFLDLTPLRCDLPLEPGDRRIVARVVAAG